MADLQAASKMTPFTMSRLIRASMRYSWRVSGSVALGVATATAVIVGALLPLVSVIDLAFFAEP